ncbi:MAG TPA: ABC transporter ATP-binding protein [Candidatus Saccharimonadales bacterium]|nr:ABC transporter ATP-binding protein [Candidatus Saccharimonadales bacterium]
MTDKNSMQALAVSVEKDDVCILNAINFTVKPGSITGLIGPSGSGKTTLMRAIAGVQTVTKGELTILGMPAGTKQLRQKIGYMSQTPAIYSDLTVIQNVRYFARLVGANKQQVANRITAVDLDEQKNQLVDKLSGGQKARVSLAITLLGNPEILILDEPTVGLDPVLRRDLWKLFKKLAEQGKTLIISSHVMDEAERCDHLLLLRDGQLLWNENRQALLESTKTHSVEAAFLHMVGNKEAR